MSEHYIVYTAYTNFLAAVTPELCLTGPRKQWPLRFDLKADLNVITEKWYLNVSLQLYPN